MQHIFLICIIRLRQRLGLGQQRLRLQTVLNYKKVIESWATGITSCYDNLRSLFHLFSVSPPPRTHSATTSAMKPQISHYTDTRESDRAGDLKQGQGAVAVAGREWKTSHGWLTVLLSLTGCQFVWHLNYPLSGCN